MTQRRSGTSRANGAKSRGPLTPEGKARSSRNSLRHGLTAAAVVLDNEEASGFLALQKSCLKQFQPATQLEMEIVNSIAASRWRLRRVPLIETGILKNAYDARLEFDSFNELPDNDHRVADVFDSCDETIARIARYEVALNRAFERSLRQLQLVRNTAASQPSGSFRNFVKKAA